MDILSDKAMSGEALRPSRESCIVPTPGTTKLHRVDENLGATESTSTTEDLGQIDEAASRIAVSGACYPEHLEKMTGP